MSAGNSNLPEPSHLPESIWQWVRCNQMKKLWHAYIVHGIWETSFQNKNVWLYIEWEKTFIEGNSGKRLLVYKHPFPLYLLVLRSTNRSFAQADLRQFRIYSSTVFESHSIGAAKLVASSSTLTIRIVIHERNFTQRRPFIPVAWKSKLLSIFRFCFRRTTLKPYSGNLILLYESGNIGYNATHNLHRSSWDT